MAEKGIAKIRRFEMEDIVDILEIEEQAFPKTGYSKEILLHYANRLPESFVVIETGADIAGYIIFDASGHIHSTAVKPPYRRRGFGKMLFAHALRCTEKRLWLEVRSRNSGAIRFYERLGMKVVKTIPYYYGSDDALVMELGESEEGQGR